MTDDELIEQIAKMSEAIGEVRALLRRILDTEPTTSLREEAEDYLQRTE